MPDIVWKGTTDIKEQPGSPKVQLTYAGSANDLHEALAAMGQNFLLALVIIQDETMRTLPIGLAFFTWDVGMKHGDIQVLGAAAYAAPLLSTLLLIAVGLAMLIAGPRWRAQARERMHERWEHRMHRRFGAGWNSLSEEERERFRAGMNHWHGRGRDHRAGAPGSEAPATPSEPTAPSDPR